MNKIFNFIDFRYITEGSQRCSEVFLLQVDVYKDFIRKALPNGEVSVSIKNSKGQVLYNLVPEEFNKVGQVLEINLIIPSFLQNTQLVYFSVAVDATEYVISDTFTVYKQTIDQINPSRLFTFAFNDYPNDYVSLRLPVGVDYAKPSDNGSQFLTSDDELIRPIQKMQTELEVFCVMKEYTKFQEKLFIAFRQRYSRIEVGAEGFFRQVIFEDDFELEYAKRYGTKFLRSANLLTKIKVNGSLSITQQDNLAELDIIAQPYAYATPYLVTQNQVGDTEFTFDILLDRPLPESQTVAYQVVAIGVNPALPSDFVGGVFPSETLTYLAGEMDKTITLNVEIGADIQDGVNFDILFTDSSLIKFNENLIVTGAIIQLSGSLDFGDVGVGLLKKLSFTIQNIGTQPMTVTSINTPTGFYDINYFGGVIAAGQSQVVEVLFEPIASIDYSGLIEVISNASSGGNTILAEGTGKLFNAMKYTLENIALTAYTPQTVTHNLDASVISVNVWESSTGILIDIEVQEINNNQVQLTSAIDVTVDIIILA